MEHAFNGVDICQKATRIYEWLFCLVVSCLFCLQYRHNLAGDP